MTRVIASQVYTPTRRGPAVTHDPGRSQGRAEERKPKEMSRHQDQELIAEFWMTLQRDCNHIPSARLEEIGRRLLAISRASHHYNEVACNIELTDRQLARSQRLDHEAARLAADLGCLGVVLNRDPRGAPIKLRFASGHTNDAGCEGLIVPF